MHLREIILNDGLTTLVSDEDYDLLVIFPWKAYHNKDRSRYDVMGRVNDQYVSLPRFLLNAPPGLEVDRIDLNPLNNQRSNLRLATHPQNQANRRKTLYKGKPCSSRYKGVTLNRNLCHRRWTAQIKYNNKVHRIGSFDTEIEAALAYDFEARKAFGEYALLNFED
jgi:hypothetical protein